MVILTKRNLRLVYANIYCDFTRQVSIHSFSAVRPRHRHTPLSSFASAKLEAVGRKIKPAQLFYPARRLNTPLASFAIAKQEAVGREFKPAQLFLSRLPLAYPTRQFCPRKIGNGWPKNKTCTTILSRLPLASLNS